MSDDSSDPFDLEWAAGDVDGPASERRFVDAALRLLADCDSYDQISVAQIARAAGRSVGAFYSRFADKDELLHQLQARLHADGVATLTRAFELVAKGPITIEQLVRGFIDLAVTLSATQRGLRRAILVQMTRDRGMRQRAIALGARTVEALADLAAPHFPGSTRDRVVDAVHVIHAMVTGAIDQRLVFGDEGPTGRLMDDAALANQLYAVTISYVRALYPENAEPEKDRPR